jgi:hypothetical protein
VFFEVARLSGPKIVIEKYDIGLMGLDRVFELLDLSRSDIGRNIDLMPLLEHAGDNQQTGCLGQPPELVQGIVGCHVAMGKNDPDQNCSFLLPGPLDAICINQGGVRPRFRDRSWVNLFHCAPLSKSTPEAPPRQRRMRGPKSPDHGKSGLVAFMDQTPSLRSRFTSAAQGDLDENLARLNPLS